MKPLIGLVLSGGGARGAYEAGVVHFIRTALPQKDIRFDIITGTSVGAINACFLAATADDPQLQGREIRRLWETLSPSRIYKTGALSIGKALLQTIKHDLLGWIKERRRDEAVPFTFYKSLQDTSPLHEFLGREIPWQNIPQNMKKGVLGALALSTTDIRTGQLVIFLEKTSPLAYIGTPDAVKTTITETHAMASAAIPILFPPIEVDGAYYCDGGLRQTTPISPAVALGAEKVLIIALRYSPLQQKPVKKAVPPSLGHIVGKVFNSIFLDHLEYDLTMMKRMNRIIDWSTKLYGPQYLEELNKAIAQDDILKHIPRRGIRKIEELTLYPSADIGSMAADFVRRNGFKMELALWHRMFFKATQAGQETESDLLSYLLFDPAYLKELFELGYEDARRQKDKLIQFFEEEVLVGKIRRGETVL
ncbi:MAG: patatin-like phospholipase family protein [Deltaproteobacteria bacterium]|nr:patatin-like phospholipase family protein [Deltaproteobacteria bacterium]